MKKTDSTARLSFGPPWCLLIYTFGSMQHGEEEADVRATPENIFERVWSLTLKKSINEFILHIKQLHAFSQHRLINRELSSKSDHRV